MTTNVVQKPYPHADDAGSLVPMHAFRIGFGRTLSLYAIKGHQPNAFMSMYWDHEQSPIQHRMDYSEVLHVLEDILGGEEIHGINEPIARKPPGSATP